MTREGDPRQPWDDAVVVLHRPFVPNVALIRASLIRYHGSVEPKPVDLHNTTALVCSAVSRT